MFFLSLSLLVLSTVKMGFRFSTLNLILVILFVKPMSLNSGVSPKKMAVRTSTGGNETDRLALIAIKALITDDPFQITRSWNESLHFCRWRGVSCGHKHQRVTRLDLLSHRLKGRISPAIGNLSFVRVIDLSNNSFQGEIPREISRLFRLQVLALMNNSLVGRVPANLSFCSDLRFIDLYNNNLTGQLPFELGLLSRLVDLDVGGNNLKGSIPPHLGNISSLRQIIMAVNMLEGHIPASLGKLETLDCLQLSGNLLSGTIPQSIYNLSQLAILFLGDNQLEGTLPRDIGLTLPKIEWFLIWGNNFSGTIPASFSNATNLFKLDVSLNNFFGGVPDMFGNLMKLEYLLIDYTNLGSGKANDLHFFNSLSNCSNFGHLELEYSNFGGTIPASIANFSTQFQHLAVNDNPVSGSIPLSIGNLKSLKVLSLDNNLLSGTIPATIGKLTKLQGLVLSNNQFSGEIPSSFGNLTSLVQLWLEGNNLQGSIPSTLGNCKDLIFLDLSSNALNGTIPRRVVGLPSMSLVFNLSRNHLVGTLPIEVGNMKNLFQFDISHNQLSSIIPESLGDCNMLSLINLDHNMFHGAIPESFSSLISIEQMDLSHNNLSEEIPKGIARLVFLSKLNLSFNALEGELPIGGVFSNASAVSIFGNDKLCGGIPQLGLQECPRKRSKKKSAFHGGKLIITITCGILSMSLMLYFLSSWWFKKKRNQQTESSGANPFATISYGELLKATNGFSSENLIGIGSTGSVYKGILEPDQTAIAVKVFNLKKRGASKSFASECETLRGVRHRKLVKIITACSSMDYQGNEFKALVYEFMANGSLESLLHPNPQAENQTPLTLPQRIDIAIDVASAVDYLHNHVETPVIHCDIKPSNILLDQENTARVGDFGLSRIIQQENEENSHNHTSSSGLKGTIGYAAPEYGMGSKVSMEGDIYSFGIFLLEMFTGKRPTDSDFEDGMSLNQFVKTALPEKAMEIVDQGLIPREVEEASSDNTAWKIYKCCVLVLKIGVMCSDESPRGRIKIDEALKQLCEAKKMLLGL